MPTYRRSALQFVRGQGAWLETASGDQYLDFTAGIAVNVLGHAHPKLVAALTTQAQELWHVSNLFTIKGQGVLATKLCASADFAERIFFCNSGAEAVEGTIKSMRKYHAAKGDTDRVNIITFAGAFHGRTLTTLAAGKREYGAGFGPLPEGFITCAAFDIEAVAALIDNHTAGILLEPIQGESGVREAPLAFLMALRGLCDRHNILLAFDEVQSGIGRTGKMYAYQWADSEPDIVALAKGLGGGFPLGAIMASAAVGDAMQAGSHGSTFGGNPLAMAVGTAVLDEVANPAFLLHVEKQGGYFHQQLARLLDTYPDILLAVRGRGLMLGLQIKGDLQDFIAALTREKLLSVGAGDNVVRFVPPLNITQDEIRTAITAIDAACQTLQNS